MITKVIRGNDKEYLKWFESDKKGLKICNIDCYTGFYGVLFNKELNSFADLKKLRDVKSEFYQPHDTYSVVMMDDEIICMIHTFKDLIKFIWKTNDNKQEDSTYVWALSYWNHAKEMYEKHADTSIYWFAYDPNTSTNGVNTFTPSKDLQIKLAEGTEIVGETRAEGVPVYIVPNGSVFHLYMCKKIIATYTVMGGLIVPEVFGDKLCLINEVEEDKEEIDDSKEVIEHSKKEVANNLELVTDKKEIYNTVSYVRESPLSCEGYLIMVDEHNNPRRIIKMKSPNQLHIIDEDTIWLMTTYILIDDLIENNLVVKHDNYMKIDISDYGLGIYGEFFDYLIIQDTAY